MHPARSRLIVAFAFSAGGCGRGIVDSKGDVTVSKTVAASGGKVTLGASELEIPAGALATDTTITVRKTTGAAGALGESFEFGPAGLTFASPATLRLATSEEPAAGIGLLVSGRWQALAGSHRGTAPGTVEGPVSHFSVYCAVKLCAVNADCASDQVCFSGVCQGGQPPEVDAGASPDAANPGPDTGTPSPDTAAGGPDTAPDTGKLGQPCTSAAECPSRFCIDGVCCNLPCTGACVSCSLPGTLGTCFPVPLGQQDPHYICPKDGPQTCGSDGTCDGAGGCRKYPKGTACGVGLTCNGAGVCQ